MHFLSRSILTAIFQVNLGQLVANGFFPAPVWKKIFGITGTGWLDVLHVTQPKKVPWNTNQPTVSKQWTELQWNHHSEPCVGPGAVSKWVSLCRRWLSLALVFFVFSLCCSTFLLIYVVLFPGDLAEYGCKRGTQLIWVVVSYSFWAAHNYSIEYLVWNHILQDHRFSTPS